MVDSRSLELFLQVFVGPHVWGCYLFVIIANEDLIMLRDTLYFAFYLDSIVVRPIWHIDILLAKSNLYSLDGFYVRQVL